MRGGEPKGQKRVDTCWTDGRVSRERGRNGRSGGWFHTSFSGYTGEKIVEVFIHSEVS